MEPTRFPGMKWNVFACGVAALALGGCGGSSASGGSKSTSTPGPPSTTTSITSVSSSGPPAQHVTRPRHVPAPGSLPQTHALPSAHTSVFRAEMRALWRGIQTNSVRAALPAFFPEAAYAQVKAISNPGADWLDRLVGTYRLDIAAAHALLSTGASRASLVRVDVPASFGHWVNPGACYNRIGYYEVPNARVVYRDAGRVRSFGIASMISWRGVWYVVHLGAVSGDSGGTVDAPSAGAGVSAPSLTC